MTTQQIYDIFIRELDGEEFSSDDDALASANLAYRTILANRDWEFLNKNATLTAGTTSLAGITDLDRPLRVWAEVGATTKTLLNKAQYDERFDTQKDYYFDFANNTVNLINDEYATNSLIVDYKYRPTALTLTTSPVFPEEYQPIIAYRMILDFKESDQDFEGYNEVTAKYNKLLGLLVDYNESLKSYA